MNYDKEKDKSDLGLVLENTITALNQSLAECKPVLELCEAGAIMSVGQGVAKISGLSRARADELAIFPGDKLGVVFNVDLQEV